MTLVNYTDEELAVLFTIGGNHLDIDEVREDDRYKKTFNSIMEDLNGANIVVALYDNENYDGNAIVLYEKNDELFIVEGSHCSCYGLEDQWLPARYSYQALEKRSFACFHNFDDKIVTALKDFALEKAVEEHDKKGNIPEKKFTPKPPSKEEIERRERLKFGLVSLVKFFTSDKNSSWHSIITMI